MKDEKLIVLENSTNTHVSKSNAEIVAEIPTMTTLVIDTNENMIIEHGHHNTVSTESDTKHVIKITQQEYNPVLQAFQNAFD